MVQASEEIVPRDLPRAFELLKEMNESVHQVTQVVDSMLQRVKTGEITTDKGLSFLEMKYHMLLSYLINLTYVVLRKCSGEKIEGDPAIDRLVEIRTVLEKVRPLDQKLKYQIGKLVKTAATGLCNAQDPSNLRANPRNMASKLPGDEDSGDSSSSDQEQDKLQMPDAGKQQKKGIYVPPKIAAVHYDGGEQSKMERLAERARKAVLKSSVIQELGEEYLDTPVEVSHQSSSKVVLSRQHRDREQYEESYFTRLPVTKQERHKSRKMTTVGTLGDELTRFGDLWAPGAGFHGPRPASRKRKLPSAKKAGKGRKGFKKRKLH